VLVFFAIGLSVDMPAWFVGVTWGAVAAFAVWLYRAFIRARIKTSTDGVVIVNPGRTTRLSWDEIETITVFTKLTFRCTDGRELAAWAVEPTNIARLLGRTTYADRVAEELNQQLVNARGRNWPQEKDRFLPSPSAMHKRRRDVLRLVISLVIVFLAWVTARGLV
jgi:hypothetical protein